MDTGNPWDSKPLAASTTAPFDNPFDSPKVDEGWANFNKKINDSEDSEMSPVKLDFEEKDTAEKNNVENNEQPKLEEEAVAETPDPKTSPIKSAPSEENIP